MTVLLPLAPFACAVIAGRWHYLRRYGQTVKQSARTIRALHQASVIARNIEMAIERSFEIAFAPTVAANSIEGSCTHCGRCCLNSACVFLTWTGDGFSTCSIHNNWFWKLTSCGSYPVNARSIAVYNCPSFRVIPIRVIALPPERSRAGQSPHTL